MRTGYQPRVCAIMPCKGADIELERNIEALLTQDYQDYRVIVVTDSTDDLAYAIAKSVQSRHVEVKAEVCISEPHPKASGKVAALLTALSKSEDQAEVYVFVDSDALISSNWLVELVEPLIDTSVGSTTGFRWYFPLHGGFWSRVEAAWNASGTNLLFDDRYNFPWGGAMAVRVETLEKIRIQEIWSNAISDDMTLNLALRKHGYRIVFLPQCVVATFNQTTMHRFLEWATRQTVLTRVFNRGLWKYALAAYSFFDLAFLSGAVGLVLGIFIDPSWFIPSALLLAPCILGIPRSYQRCETFKRAVPHLRPHFERNCLADSIASFIVPWIMTYCIIKSALTHEIEWRGRRYTLTGMKSLAAP